MKVLFDSNLWRYLADYGERSDLESACAASGIEVVVAPALVFEARRLRDDATRKKILALLAHENWTRLLPEAYLEVEEIKAIVRRSRPEWIVAKPDLTEVGRLRDDWERREGGFWSRAQNDVEPPVTDESSRGDREHDLAR